MEFHASKSEPEVIYVYKDRFEKMTKALSLIAAQSDEALMDAGKSDPLWAKRVALAALAQ